MLAQGDTRVVRRDAQGKLRFHTDFYNADRCAAVLAEVRAEARYPALDDNEVTAILDIYEQTFDHRSFTGRSGSMFAYEGLGSIYWHMVAKLLLAASEKVFLAVEQSAPREVILDL